MHIGLHKCKLEENHKIQVQATVCFTVSRSRYKWIFKRPHHLVHPQTQIEIVIIFF